ncbi:MAG: YraN family protein [Desulfofundulus sp.]|uniref:YraN family protein n=1 Tax=Desulfofundulus sp. TaxID=2282750 RepID=UPI003C7222BC
MTLRRKAQGRKGEDEAARYLAGLGYRLVARNYRCLYGEVDIIARDGRTLVFVEVRSRTTNNYGLPQESVGSQKRTRLRRVACCYLAAGIGHRGPVRFDVLAIKYGADGRVESLAHIKNAF